MGCEKMSQLKMIQLKQKLNNKKNQKRGAFLTLDVILALMVLFSLIVVALYNFYSPKKIDNPKFLKTSLEDVALAISNSNDDASIRNVIYSLPPSICADFVVYCHPFEENLIAYWNFEENGNIVSGLKNGYVGVKFGNPNQSSGVNGKSIYFNGSNFIQTNADISWNDKNQITISFWINPDDESTSNQAILGKTYPDWEWTIWKSGKSLGLVYWDSSGGHSNGIIGYYWGNVLSAGNWTHIAYVWYGQESYFYVNGQLVSVGFASNPSFNRDNSANISIGGHIYLWGDSYFKGQIDDLRIFNRALSGAEIEQLYFNPSNVKKIFKKENCDYSSGSLVSLSIPFLNNQAEYCSGILRGWYKK
jgi:hypothetical protein